MFNANEITADTSIVLQYCKFREMLKMTADMKIWVERGIPKALGMAWGKGDKLWT